MRIATLVAPILTGLLSLPAFAQAAPGGWLIADAGAGSPGLFRMQPTTGVMTPIATGLYYYPASVIMAADNSHLLAADIGTSSLEVVAAGGTRVPNAVFGSTPGQLALDQDGTVLCAANYGAERVDLATATSTPYWSSIRQFLFGVCLDGDTGDAMFAGFYYLIDGRLNRVNRRTGVGTMLANGLGPVSSCDFDPLTGDFLVTNGDAISPLLRVFRNGTVASMGMYVPAGANAVRIDPETGNILVAGQSLIRLLAPSGALLRSWPLPAGAAVTGLEFSGSRKVSGHGPATAGSSYTLDYSFPGAANGFYIGLFALSMRPGLPLNDGTGRVVSLGANTLLTAFSGSLDANGRASRALAIPPGLPADVRIFASAVVLDPSAPSGVLTANTFGFSTN